MPVNYGFIHFIIYIISNFPHTQLTSTMIKLLREEHIVHLLKELKDRSFRLLVKYKLVVIFVPTKTSLIRFVYYEIWSRIVAIVKIDYNVIIPVTYEVRYVLVLYAETYSYFSMLITWNSLDFHSELCFSCYYNFTYLIWNKKVILHITK